MSVRILFTKQITGNNWKETSSQKSFKVFALSTKRWDEYLFASFDLWKLSYFCQFLSKRNQFRMLFGSKEIKGRTNWIALLSYCYHCELHCVSSMACHAQVVFLFYQLQFLCTCKIQNALWMIAIFIFQIQYAALSLNPLTFYLCLCDKLVFFFFPRDIYFCQVHLHSLESNTQECFSSFSLVSSLTESLPSNDTFYQSKVFSISLPGF